MLNKNIELLRKLSEFHSLTEEEYAYLVSNMDEEAAAYAEKEADKLRKEIYGNAIFIRGLIEIGNICRNNCYYCGIRHSNKDCERYLLTKEQIYSCCEEGHKLGFRTFVLQGGERCGYPVDAICEIVKHIKTSYSDCAVTLSLGEYEKKDYEAMYKAGAERYLLRHETADKGHYQKLHPKEMSFENRMECLKNLKEIGFQTGCGFMVGSPYQTPYTIAKDLKFIENFQPEMCGIGPFIPHKSTPFRNEPAGSADLTIYLLSLIRLICPGVLLPATTALNTIGGKERGRGIKAGANVIMPNLSPKEERSKYTLYNKKAVSGDESAQGLEQLKEHMKNIGYQIVVDRGDYRGGYGNSQTKIKK